MTEKRISKSCSNSFPCLRILHDIDFVFLFRTFSNVLCELRNPKTAWAVLLWFWRGNQSCTRTKLSISVVLFLRRMLRKICDVSRASSLCLDEPSLVLSITYIDSSLPLDTPCTPHITLSHFFIFYDSHPVYREYHINSKHPAIQSNLFKTIQWTRPPFTIPTALSISLLFLNSSPILPPWSLLLRRRCLWRSIRIRRMRCRSFCRRCVAFEFDFWNYGSADWLHLSWSSRGFIAVVRLFVLHLDSGDVDTVLIINSNQKSNLLLLSRHHRHGTWSMNVIQTLQLGKLRSAYSFCGLARCPPQSYPPSPRHGLAFVRFVSLGFFIFLDNQSCRMSIKGEGGEMLRGRRVRFVTSTF